jgi:hypothetical protein
MNKENLNDDYYDTEFAQQISKIIENPETLDTKDKLRSLWELALSERNRNKSIQERIATEAARHIGTVVFDNNENDPYQAVILQFARMDHMDENYGEIADEEWNKLADMISKL